MVFPVLPDNVECALHQFAFQIQLKRGEPCNGRIDYVIFRRHAGPQEER